MINFLKSFPAGYTPNAQQELILSKLSEAYNNGKKYAIVNAPTGSGKSLVAKAMANSLGKLPQSYIDFVESGAIYDDDIDFGKHGTVVLTMTKALQDQYIGLFSDGAVLKGKSNYPCSLSDVLSCDIGACVLDKTIQKCDNCPYYEARDNALANPCAFLSYSMFMALPDNCKNRKFIVCDEASELEDMLVDHNSVTFDFKALAKIKAIDIPPTPKIDSSYDNYKLWLKSFKTEVYMAWDEMRGEIYGKKKNKTSKKDIIIFKILGRLNDTCDRILSNMASIEYIIEHDKGSLTFKPYKVDKLAQDMFNHGEFIVLMSATIIDPANFAKQLGITPDEFEYIEAPSTFDPKKAPIYLSDEIGVTYANKAVTIPKLARVAKAICESHGDQKGIIHTHSMDITGEVKRVLGNGKRFLYREPGTTNEMLINEHTDSDGPTVLVSPSMSHGVDLKGKLGEFAIIMKAPFLPLGDKRVKRLCDEDKDWYMDKMLSNFIQMCGRTIRSAKDTSRTYVLDATLTRKLIEMKDRIPKYFLDRIP